LTSAKGGRWLGQGYACAADLISAMQGSGLLNAMKNTVSEPLSVYDVAKLIKTSDQIVRRAIRNGALKAHLHGPRLRNAHP